MLKLASRPSKASKSFMSEANLSCFCSRCRFCFCSF